MEANEDKILQFDVVGTGADFPAGVALILEALMLSFLCTGSKSRMRGITAPKLT